MQTCEAEDAAARALAPAGAVGGAAPASDLAHPAGMEPITTAANEPSHTSGKVTPHLPPFPPRPPTKQDGSSTNGSGHPTVHLCNPLYHSLHFRVSSLIRLAAIYVHPSIHLYFYLPLMLRLGSFVYTGRSSAQRVGTNPKASQHAAATKACLPCCFSGGTLTMFSSCP